ncbi:PD-(D/E)XK nuclease family protein [Patescibacteria group bacterium]|nr:PD-(D/E)XK nuclease family protein [Patescibacteria group bacterium]
MKCPLHYYFRYIKGVKIPPTSAMTLGISVHSALEVNFRQKIQSKKDLPIEAVLEAYSDSFESAKQETAWEKDENPAEVKDEGMNLICAYHTGKDRNEEPMMYRELNSETKKYEKKLVQPLSPQIMPLFVETPFEIQFNNDVGYTFIGRMDLVDDQHRIHDIKTSAKTPTKDQVDADLQMTAYALGFRVKTGATEKGLVMDYIIKNKSPKIMSVETYRTREDIDRLLQILGSIANAVEKGIFYCSCNSIFCGPQNCQYWDMGNGKGCKFGVTG